MKNKDKLILTIALMVAIIAGAALVYNNLIKDYKPEVLSDGGDGTPQAENVAPDFWATDEKGEKVSLSDMKGKPTVVNFWASWCYYCKEEMPDFQKAYEELGGEINFMMVNMTDGSRETKELARDYIKKGGFTFPVYFDEEKSAAITYQAYSLPMTLFFDKDKNLITYANGKIDYETLKKGIDMIR